MAHEVTNAGSDRAQLSKMAGQPQEPMGHESQDAVPAAEAERPLPIRLRDIRRDARQWSRHTRRAEKPVIPDSAVHYSREAWPWFRRALLLNSADSWSVRTPTQWPTDFGLALCSRASYAR